MAAVGFLTFGFTQTVCGKPPLRFRTGTIQTGSVIIKGFDYDFSHFNHPPAGETFNGSINPLFVGNWHVAGADISFLFQSIGNACDGMFTVQGNSTISKGNNLQPDWIFPCNPFNQFGTSGTNFSDYGDSYTCHIQSSSRTQLASIQPKGEVYYTWDDVKSANRNLAVYER
jgi:chitin synthase